MSWRDRPMLGIDTETTSTDPETARIVTMCAGLATARGWSPKNWTFTQDQPIPAEATAVHGITTEWANEYGTDLRDGLEEFVRGHLYRAWDEGMPVVLYNALYDLTVIDRELRRSGLPPLEIRGPVVDPLVIERELDPERFIKRPERIRRFTEIYAALGIDRDPADIWDDSVAIKPPGWQTLRIVHYRRFGRDMEGDAHGAEPDARAACRLAYFWAGKPLSTAGRWMAMSGTPLPRLHAMQAGWYRKWHTSFGEWLAKRGEEIDGRATDWPLRPFAVQAEAAA